MKKGFTLIELIGIIVILGVISFIVFPVVSSSIKNGKEKAYNEQVGRIIEAAKKWANDNTDLLPSDDEELYVKHEIQEGKGRAKIFISIKKKI